LVDGGFLPYAKSRAGAAAALAARVPKPAHLKLPQHHHDLWFAKADWFAIHGLDVNDPTYLRRVEGTPDGGAPAGWQLHQNWHGDFERVWNTFISAESATVRRYLLMFNRGRPLFGHRIKTDWSYYGYLNLRQLSELLAALENLDRGILSTARTEWVVPLFDDMLTWLRTIQSAGRDLWFYAS
jgi:hypothetical protein